MSAFAAAPVLLRSSIGSDDSERRTPRELAVLAAEVGDVPGLERAVVGGLRERAQGVFAQVCDGIGGGGHGGGIIGGGRWEVRGETCELARKNLAQRRSLAVALPSLCSAGSGFAEWTGESACPTRVAALAIVRRDYVFEYDVKRKTSCAQR